MESKILHTITKYNYALWQRVWDSIFTLSEDQFLQEVPYSHGSLRNQMVHTAGVDGRWLRGLKGMPDPRFFRPAPADYPDRQSAHALWQSTSQDVLDYAAGLTDSRWSKPRPA